MEGEVLWQKGPLEIEMRFCPPRAPRLLPAALAPALLAACTVGGGGTPRSGARDLPPDSAPRRAEVLTGLEVLRSRGFADLRGKRVGLVTNGSGVDRELRSTADLLAGADGVELKAIFAPEHGFRGALEAGAQVADQLDPATGVPVHSLYGAVRSPTPEMLQGIDVLVYDIQDVGARTYTYLSTLRGCLEAAAEKGIEAWVLDRPDPLGGAATEGPVLEERFESFVGPHTIPLRYGMTAGEFARMVNEERRIGARLRVVPLRGWRRGMTFAESGLPWVPPSPNIPTADTCLLFPGFVLLEGTNLSEGRGTTRPFKLFGAPWLDARSAARELSRLDLPGVHFRATEFTPSDSKHRGAVCGAVEVHVTDPSAFRAGLTAVAVLSVVHRLHPEKLELKDAAFDRLAGGEALRRAILRGDPPKEIAASWSAGLAAFEKRRQAYLIYR